MQSTPEFYAKDRAAWRSWLIDHHDIENAVWLVFDKGSRRTMTWSDIVQEALCFGWIDSLPGKVSDTRSKIYVSRRKPKSVWSKVNKQHVETLRAAGLMTPAGERAIAIARENGSWDALNRSDNLEISDELAAAFSQYPAAKVRFEELTGSKKRNILERIYDAKTDATRERRIEQAIAALSSV